MLGRWTEPLLVLARDSVNATRDGNKSLLNNASLQSRFSEHNMKSGVRYALVTGHPNVLVCAIVVSHEATLSMLSTTSVSENQGKLHSRARAAAAALPLATILAMAQDMVRVGDDDNIQADMHD